jgi:hypothetical protein
LPLEGKHKQITENMVKDYVGPVEGWEERFEKYVTKKLRS